MRPVRVIATAQLQLFLRSRLAMVAFVLLASLSIIAAWNGATQFERMANERAVAQSAANRAFANQPDRHPHRMVHYGTYALRNLGPLAAFDSGVDAFAGSLIYLEGHRQNATTLGTARESSGLIRFGQLTPAFVLRTLVPLLLIFVGFSMLVSERQSGLINLQLTHGISAGQLVMGKIAALGTIALAAALPALGSIFWAGVAQDEDAAVALVIAASVLLWLAFWVVAITLASAQARSAQSALLALVMAWTLLVVLVPRAAAGVAMLAYPLPSKAELDLVIHDELRALGDSHNPNDPHFAAFKAGLLRRYQVSRVEDLPFNFRGALSTEGERLTSKLFARHASEMAQAQLAQHRLLTVVGLISPAIGFAQASMAGAGTDLASHLAFLDAAEAHRYRLIQSLNGLHTFQVRASDDAARNRDPIAERQSRISARFWANQKPFHHDGPSAQQRIMNMLPGLTVMLAWLIVVIWALTGLVRKGLP